MSKSFKQFIKNHLAIKIVKSVNTPVFQGSLLSGKNAVIVGAGGIGKAIAEAFIRNGCKVAITGTNPGKIESTCNSLGGVDVQGFVLNVKDINCIEDSFRRIVKKIERVDIFVYAAGVHCHDRFGSVSEKIWDDVMDVNLKGMYFADQVVSNYMKENGIKGHILNIGSASCNKPGWTPYEISKNGVRALTLGFADKLIPYGIIVNSIAPGPVATPMLKTTDDNLAWNGNPSGRVATPEEIANVAVMMVSDMGTLVVGDTLFVSGGSGTVCLDK